MRGVRISEAHIAAFRLTVDSPLARFHANAHKNLDPGVSDSASLSARITSNSSSTLSVAAMPAAKNASWCASRTFVLEEYAIRSAPPDGGLHDAGQSRTLQA